MALFVGGEGLEPPRQEATELQSVQIPITVNLPIKVWGLITNELSCET